MLRTIIATEHDGFNVRTLTLTFDVPDEDFDLIGAVRKASTDYCKTEEGKELFEYNCSAFNWADFDSYVPQEFCEKYGFRKIDAVLSDIEVNWDEQLVDESEVYESDDC